MRDFLEGPGCVTSSDSLDEEEEESESSEEEEEELDDEEESGRERFMMIRLRVLSSSHSTHQRCKPGDPSLS
jgi:hypothetical protein